MIDANEASERACELVMQYVGAAGPECEQDYLKLLIMLGTVVSGTLAAYLGLASPEIQQLNRALDDIADEMRERGPESRAEANSKRLH